MNVNGTRLVSDLDARWWCEGEEEGEGVRKTRANLRDIAEASMRSARSGIENFGREFFALLFTLYFRAANNYWRLLTGKVTGRESLPMHFFPTAL